MNHVEDFSRSTGASRHIVGSATVHAVLFFAAASFAHSTEPATTDAQAEAMRPYLVALEERSRASDITASGSGCDQNTADINDSEGDGFAGGGEKHEQGQGKMGSSLSRERETRRWSAPRKVSAARDEENGEAGGSASNFGIIGLLAKNGALPFPLPGERSLDKSPDPVLSKGAMWARSLGTSFGNEATGLSGTGIGGGGKAEGIGMGEIGTLGHTFGKAGMGTGGKGTLSATGFGMSWWDGIGHRLALTGRSWSGGWRHDGYIGCTVSGRLPPEAIQRVVRANFGRFRLCYENGLVTNPALAGRVSTKFAIGSEGQVLWSTDESHDLPDASVVACVTRAFSSLTFPAPPDASQVTVVYPITFSSEARTSQSFAF
jgi:hypothetical protein